MSSTKLLGLVNLKTLPKDLPKLLDEPVSILKGAEEHSQVLEKQGLKKVWQAPDKPGIYKVSVRLEDLALIRPPNEGIRKDKEPLELTVVILVKE